MMNPPKILLFVAGRPINYDRQLAATVPVPVQYRDIYAIDPAAPAEACDGVMGTTIPAAYLSFPTGKEAMTAYRNAQRSEALAELAASSEIQPLNEVV